MKNLLAVVTVCLVALTLVACDEGCGHRPEAFDVHRNIWGCRMIEIDPEDLYYDEDEWDEESDLDGDGYGDHITVYVDASGVQFGTLRPWNGGLSYDPYPGAHGTEEIRFYAEDACGQKSRDAVVLIEVDCWE